jgi:SAM-dependent methyltransferase
VLGLRPVVNKGQHHRLHRALRPHLAGGWERAMFAAPQTGDESRDERVVSGPGAGAPTPEQVDALLAEASEAADAGLYKQTIVLDARRRVQVDARHGRPLLRTLDEATARKVMGGKDRALRPDTSAALLREIGIMNADGSISATHARKYKQISHLATLCERVIERLSSVRPLTPEAPLRALDLACGNAYLSFVLAEVLRLRQISLRLHGVDVRADVVARSRARAQALGIDGLSFAEGDIAAAAESAPAALGGSPDLILALHACDTATDEALELAIRLGAPAILCVPCCQAELAAQLAERGQAARHPIAAIVEHGLLRRAYADVLTDGIRVAVLEACSYEVTVIEFVGSEHTAKNLLLRAFRRHPRAPVEPQRWKLAPLADRCRELGLTPDLLRRLLPA